MLAFFISYPQNHSNPMTVHEALITYTKTYKYKFTQKHKMIIGALVAKEYRSKYGLNIEIPTIMSAEENGTFRVFDYPPKFIVYIDNLIHSYVIRLKQSKPKRKNEKPLIKEPSAPNSISYSSKPTSPPKKRARKPVQSPSKPEFSGKKLIKGK